MAAAYIRFDTVYSPVAFPPVEVSFEYYHVAVWLALTWIPFFWFEHLYDLQHVLWGAEEFTRIVRALSMGVVAFILLTFALRLPGLSRAWVLLSWLLAVGTVSLTRLGIRFGLQRLRAHGRLMRPTLIVGSNGEAGDIARLLSRRKYSGLEPIGYVPSGWSGHLQLNYCDKQLDCLGEAEDLAAVVAHNRVDTVVIASSAFEHETISRMLADLRGIDVDIHISSGLFEVLTSRVLVREVCGVPLITVRSISLSRWNMFVKRVFDLSGAGAGVLLGLPIWLAIALAIKCDSKGPVLYRQARVGQGGEPFGMLKFRSMADDADARLEDLMSGNEADGPLFKIRDDPRVTRVGRWMRRYSIDEFPQLLNVLKGEMSLVGPRPPLVHETHQYTDRHWRRMEVLPGMTGLWQVSGRSQLSFEEMVRLDLFYIENWSVTLDVWLLLKTVPAVMFAKGAY